jgi:Fe-S-cluster containining protein
MHPGPGCRLVRMRVGVRTRSGAVEVEVHVPADGCRPGDVLPALRAIDDALVADACQASAAAGRPVSCRAGCGTCCRHLVVVTPFEAVSLMRLVETLPPNHRREVRSRFAAAQRALTNAGLRDEMAQAPLLPRAALRALALRYFRLGTPCPFLESERCSIYSYRPLVCREYVVASPPGLCRTLRHIERVSVPGRLFPRISRNAGDGPNWVPLALAPDWVAEQPPAGQPGRERSGPQLLTDILEADGTRPVHA